ncbi:hypothetical protein FH972_001444 [Carpinus fangiana]|uniref:Uncharacterized protein n=1 Tax=Carpinus fangiana TaxID=176857 RepID=A0A5N6QE48_9ROSI|nr:hypothetical protein FH972_001444 [Carpinus fangiana]
MIYRESDYKCFQMAMYAICISRVFISTRQACSMHWQSMMALAPNSKSFKQPYYLMWKIAESYYPKKAKKMHDTPKSFPPKNRR